MAIIIIKLLDFKFVLLFLGFKYWVNIYTYSTDDLSDDYLEREVIDIYNKIVYPNKYFVTNADNT